MEHPECIFCKIVKKELPAHVVYENNDVLAFLDIRPINLGHTLVIPKKHFENLFTIDDSTMQALSLAIRNTAKAIKSGLKPDGVNIGMNNGEAAGQIVYHAHIHVIPRLSNDGLTSWPGKEFPDKDFSEAAKNIRGAFDA